jgi:hypothetical protein
MNKMNKTNGKIWSLLLVLIVALPAAAGAASSGHSGHGKADAADHGAAAEAVFEHQEAVDGLRAEFQVMSLASMNMKDPDGKTHHIMVKLFDETRNQPIENAVGKIKVIGPDGGEQEGLLKDYSGILAANFSFPQKGKYGVICLFKVDNKKHLIKFWYDRV